MSPYYLDMPRPAETFDGAYTVVIRAAGRPGWIFRFQKYNDFTDEVLDRLNHPEAIT